MRRSFAERVDEYVSRCRPISTGGRVLLRRYVESLDLSREKHVDIEIRILGELCRLVEEINLDGLGIERLHQLSLRPAPSKTASFLRRRLARRLIRLLQADGAFPQPGDLRAQKRLQRILDETSAAGRGRLCRWIEEQREHHDGRRKVGWGQLLVHARALAELEAMIDELELDDSDAKDAVELWLNRLVREIVDCGCPPVTRAITPEQCNCCGATAATHGTRLSPAVAKQNELEALGRRYLNWCFPTDQEEAA
jgi:hypothetical protein